MVRPVLALALLAVLAAGCGSASTTTQSGDTTGSSSQALSYDQLVQQIKGDSPSIESITVNKAFSTATVKTADGDSFTTSLPPFDQAQTQLIDLATQSGIKVDVEK